MQEEASCDGPTLVLLPGTTSEHFGTQRDVGLTVPICSSGV